jgi:hypothetical protein
VNPDFYLGDGLYAQDERQRQVKTIVITEVLRRQLSQHGYSLTDDELRDVAAQLSMALTEHPIYRLLSARLAIVEAGIEGGGGTWFYGDVTPEAESILREWAADHADAVRVEDRKIGLVVDHRNSYHGIATVYPSAAGVEAEPAPAPRVTTADEPWSPTEVRS